jgi:hypothetical protein
MAFGRYSVALELAVSTHEVKDANEIIDNVLRLCPGYLWSSSRDHDVQAFAYRVVLLALTR